MSGLPAVAIGGVSAANATEVVATGVAGLAVVSAVFAAPDVVAATRQLREAVDVALARGSMRQAAGEVEQEEAVAAAVGVRGC
jgi:hypothetical protein